MVGLPALFAIVGAFNLMLLGGALAGRYGIIAGLGGGVLGAFFGYVAGFTLGLLTEESGPRLDRLAKKRPFLGAGARASIFILLVASSVAYWFAAKHILLLPLKEKIRVQSAKAAQERLARDGATNTNQFNKRR
jgi:hypothetical protein